MSDRAGIPHLVLVGAGHAHLAFLRRIASRRIQARVTVVSPSMRVPYSGMVPGWMAGRYPLESILVDWRPWAARAGVEWVAERAVGIDANRRCVGLASGVHVDYDLLSLDVGSETELSWLGAAGERLSPLKPLDEFVGRWPRLLDDARRASRYHLVVVGGGAAGVEVACAAVQAFRSLRSTATVSLVAAGFGLLPELPPRARRFAADALARHGVEVLPGPAAGHAQGVMLGSGLVVRADRVIAATGPRAPYWLSRSGLTLSAAGFVAVGPTLQSVSHADVFAAGDIAALPTGTAARSGVYAVRAGPVLGDNLLRTLERRPLRAYRPQRRSLYLLSTGDGRAIAIRGVIVVGGRLCWCWKDWIDRRYIRRSRGMSPGVGNTDRVERSWWRGLLVAAASPDVLRVSLRVAAVVGTVLNLINQGSALLGHGPFDWLRGLLNYLVPFCVASYSGARQRSVGGGAHGKG